MTAPWWDSASVGPFREVALRFTGLIDAHASRSTAELLHAAHTLLPQLYGAALALPVKPEEAFEDIPDDAVYTVPEPDRAALDRHHARWRALVDGIAAQLGPRWTHYQEAFDPYAEPPGRRRSPGRWQTISPTSTSSWPRARRRGNAVTGARRFGSGGSGSRVTGVST